MRWLFKRVSWRDYPIRNNFTTVQTSISWTHRMLNTLWASRESLRLCWWFIIMIGMKEVLFLNIERSSFLLHLTWDHLDVTSVDLSDIGRFLSERTTWSGLLGRALSRIQGYLTSRSLELFLVLRWLSRCDLRTWVALRFRQILALLWLRRSLLLLLLVLLRLCDLLEGLLLTRWRGCPGRWLDIEVVDIIVIDNICHVLWSTAAICRRRLRLLATFLLHLLVIMVLLLLAEVVVLTGVGIIRGLKLGGQFGRRLMRILWCCNFLLSLLEELAWSHLILLILLVVRRIVVVVLLLCN